MAGARPVHLWPDLPPPQAPVYACVWNTPAGAWAKFPDVRAIFSLGAGVDHILRDQDRPQAPISRVVDPDLTMRMAEYVSLHVLMHHRRQRLYERQQVDRHWQAHPQPAAHEVNVGVMGMGQIGSGVADTLARLGFRVAGWSLSERPNAPVPHFAGEAGLHAFLGRTDILVCLLPATPATAGILNLDLFRRLRRGNPLGGAYLINAGRGALQVDNDILAALDEGALAAATLDVFPTEPLPQDNPLWAHPQVTITPHNAADVSPDVLARLILAQIERLERGQPLLHQVDPLKGY